MTGRNPSHAAFAAPQGHARRPGRPRCSHPSRTRPAPSHRRSRCEFVPKHVAIVMDGNGRWANQRGLPRVEGHKRGEAVVLDVAAARIEIGVKWISLYAFSTENWKRSPDEVRFLMNFNRDVIHRRVDELDELGVRVRWAGRQPQAVAQRRQRAEDRRGAHQVQRRHQPDHVRELRRPGRDRRRRQARSRDWSPPARSTRTRSTSALIAKYMYQPDMPDVTCSSGRPASSARRTSCCGSPRTPNWCSRTSCGPTSTASHLWRAMREVRQAGPAVRRRGRPVRRRIRPGRHAPIAADEARPSDRARHDGPTAHGRAQALERFHDVHVDDDGALTFRHGDVPCALQAMQLAEGLAVLSLTCVVAWDLPDSPALASSAAERAGQGLFGTLGRGAHRARHGRDAAGTRSRPAV